MKKRKSRDIGILLEAINEAETKSLENEQTDLNDLKELLNQFLNADENPRRLEIKKLYEAGAPLTGANGIRKMLGAIDMEFFGRAYFPHYFSRPSPEFHRDLDKIWLEGVMKGMYPLTPKAAKVINRTQGKRRVVAAPRGHAKSTTLTFKGTMHSVLYEYKHYPIIISDSSEQAEGFLDNIRIEFEENTAILEDFGNLCGSVWRSNVLLTKSNIKIEAIGSGKKIRGRKHRNWRPDLLVLDDVENDENVRTPEQRKKLENWFLKAVTKSGDDYTDIIYIGTLLHYDSLLAKTLRNPCNQAQDKLGGETAMRYIQDTNPVVIVDEPQSVDNTPKAKEAIASLNPLCVLRYSATHKEKINLLYRLTPVDAYQMGLVKQIVVSSNQIANDFNKPYIKLLSVSQEGGFKAKLEIDVRNKDGVAAHKTVTVKPGANLFSLSGNRELYEGYHLSGIDCTPGIQSVEFSNTETVALGKAIGSVDENILKKAQIRRTIEAHLDKELRYTAKGIKVLSLFFIDEVKKYRTVDGEKGIYAQMFEQCYQELLNLPKYAELKKQFPADVQAVHNGYFSQDKKGSFKDTKGDTIADYDTYNTIMKDKEWLLSFDCPLRFIWSHSALKEGWDNPNVFQVCTLIEQKSTFTCRQKVGRGLRLCVNQDGERIEDKNINVLHVMANESFAEFAETLQREIESETGVKFGILQLSLFQGMTYEEKIVQEKTVDAQDAKLVVDYMVTHGYLTEDGKPTGSAKVAILEQTAPLPPQMETAKESLALAIQTGAAVKADDIVGQAYTETITVEKTVSYEEATQLMDHFEKKDYITKTGKIKDTMKNALLSGTLDLPKKFEAARSRFENIITRTDQRPPLRDASREVTVRLNKQVLISPEFRELWDRIKQKTAYRVQIDTEKLVDWSVRDLQTMPPIPKARLMTQTADINIENAGVTHFERGMKVTDLETTYETLPHIISIISEETLIKRATVRRILMESGRSADFLHNPQAFLEKVLEIIRRNRHELAIDGIKYVKLDGEEYYAMEIFDSAELTANLDKDAVAVKNSVYDYVVYDSSTIEKPFAVALDNDPDVKLFFKLPSRFKIETPIGTYNPDWAVYMDKDGSEKLYFVMETKGVADTWNLRTIEQLKIHCGEQHFKALENGTSLRVARSWNEFKVNN